MEYNQQWPQDRNGEAGKEGNLKALASRPCGDSSKTSGTRETGG